MPGSYIGEADILIGADARNLAKDVQRQAQANLKSVGQLLGRQLSDSVGSQISSSASKIAAPLGKAVSSAASAAKRPLQNLAAGFNDAKAAASSFTGTAGKLGGEVRKAVDTAAKPIQNLVSGFKDSQAAASSFTGTMGTLGGAAAKALGPAITAAQNFVAGWGSAQAGLSSFTGLWGTFGTAARAATTLAARGLAGMSKGLSGIASAAQAGFAALGKLASKTWEGIKSGAAAAAKLTGQAITTSLKGAATGAAATISGAVGVILGKGFARLNSLNQAEARLEGLGLKGEKLARVMKSADEAVTGTAYSMADAANAAGMLASAGIEAGTQMDDAMKALVATTAASGREMSEVTPIYTKMAAAGKVTGETMAQMLDAGINASGALQKSLGKTAEEITAMVRGGEIDFDTFVEAINGDLSMLAASMGGTLGGMASNVVAAFSRVGAEVQKPIFDALLVAMPAVLDFTKRLATAVKEFMEPLQGSLEPLANRLKTLFEGLNPSVDGIKAFTQALGPLLPLLGAIVGSSAGLLSNIPILGDIFGGLTGPLGAVLGVLAALVAVDPSTMLAGFQNIGGFLQSQLPGIVQKAIGLIQTGLSNLVQNLPIMLEGVTSIVVQLLTTITNALPQIIPMLVSAIGVLIPQLIQSLLTAIPLILNASIALFGGIIEGLLQTMPMLVIALVDAIPKIIDTLVEAVPMILDGALQMFTGILDALVVAVPLIIKALVEALPKIIESLVEAIPKIIGAAIEFFLGIIQGLTQAIPAILTAVIGAIPQILNALIGAIPQLIEAGFTMFLGLIDGLITAIPQILEAVIGMIPVILEGIIGAIPQIIEAGFQLFLGLIDGLWNAMPKIWEAVTKDLLPSIWGAITGKKKDAEESGKGLGEATASGLSSTSLSFSTAGSSLAASASTGLTAGTDGLTSAASQLGSTASTTLGSYSGSMSTAASGLGRSAVDGLSGQLEATRGAASDLANAATINPKAKAEESKKAGLKIAQAFSSGISSGASAAGAAAGSVATAAQTKLSATSGFVTVGRRLAQGVATGITAAQPQVTAALNVMALQAQAIVVSRIVNTVGSAFAALWAVRVSPTLTMMVRGFTTSLDQIRSTWGSMVSRLVSDYNGRLRPMLDAFSRAVRTGPPSAFAQAATSIIREWGRIQNAAKVPVRFVIQTVMNGLIGAMNQIPGVNVPRLSLPAGFARGGILPGYSTMGQGDDQLIMARRGEGMMVSEALRTPADRAAFLAANAAGRRGVGFADAIRGFARGGLVTPLPRGSFSVSQPYHGGHNGIDLAAAMGTKIYAAAKGIVGLAGSVPMGGNEIYIQHDNGLGTRYSHLSRFAVRAGQAVRKNQVIGYVGSTGMSTGPHLHYMVHNPGGGAGNYGNNVNPAPFLGVYGSEVDGFLDVIRNAASTAQKRFTDTFSPSNMFNAATGGVLAQAMPQMIGYAKSKLGSDYGSTGVAGIRPKLYDSGGWIDPGLNVVINKSRKPEAVLTHEESVALKSALSSGFIGQGLEVYVQNPWTGEYMLAQVDERADARIIKSMSGASERSLNERLGGR